MTRHPVRVLHTMSAWGGGHVQTAINILKGMTAHGADVAIDLPRARVDMGSLAYRASIGWPLARFALPRAEPALIRRTEARYLAHLREGDVAWLWPGVSLATYREISRRGNPIVMEGINTRIAHARAILDAVRAAEGLPRDPALTDARIEEEEACLALATHFFSPSPGVDAALAGDGSSFSGHVMASSYGAWMPDPIPGSTPRAEGPLTVLFAGTVGLRKNAHGVLRAWARLAPAGAKLVFCGGVEPEIERICATELARADVELRGHVADMAAAYRAADIFVMPSFEEGDPQVTYEAAGAGLPIVASPMGGGRLAERSDAVRRIDPWDVDDIAAALDAMLSDAALREDMAGRVRAAAPRFDWGEVGRERRDLLDRAPV